MKWTNWFSRENRDMHGLRDGIRDETRALLSHLPTRRDDVPPSPIPAKEVTRTAVRLKKQIEAVIPCELEVEKVSKPHSPIITDKVIATSKAAGGPEVVYCLLIVKKWFRRQAQLELWDAEMHDVRAAACEVIAKQIIEREEDEEYLMQEVLLKRYSILVDNEATIPANAIERAVDLHALDVISSSGYQKCIAYLWKGWIIQDDEDPSRFVQYGEKTNDNYWVHFDPDRMRVPVYQNGVQVAFSLIFLALYTGAINTINPTGDIDPVEGLLYIFTLGFVCDELSKLWKVGRYYIGFWNIFNATLYALLTVSFVLRMVALGHPFGTDDRRKFNELSYNFLAFSAPMFWMRLLLYLDSFRFFGAMLVVLKVMMKESLIFFALLLIILIGFLQAFIGMDQVDNNLTATNFILSAMANSIMQSPDFSGFENYAPPFGLILYYIYTFVVMVVLLNILIALYNSAYEDITEKAIDEYMAIFAQKTMQFVRAPDENVFIAPFNLIELLCLVLPFEWWLPKKHYEKLNDYVMGAIYSPVLLVTAFLEQREARHVKFNRGRSEADDDTIEEWEQLGEEEGGDERVCGKEWLERCESTKPNVEVEGAVVEIRQLRGEMEELRKLILGLKEDRANGGDSTKDSGFLGESMNE
ncbi:hypothetical protein K402DRAFT_449808 [Aulographum hederae CBS 113979]|uniref:Uncharacterized protein n=1 Tax=Aulographum hederae CBS 113979 TaxID=1176131 RepID=A0A6G1HH29_9PEZI|nr:hypothetical protein K402DRAFT_449808 [Aulographum hederae CBS 113979]